MKDNSNLIEIPELIEMESIENLTVNGKLGKFKGISFIQIDIETPIAGYGKCRSCDCKGYVSKHNHSHECKNCHHHFDRHRD